MTAYQNFTLLDRREYFAALLQDIQATKPGEYIALTAMEFDPAVAAVAEIFAALAEAAQRGVKAYVSVDAINFMDLEAVGPFWRVHPLSRTSSPSCAPYLQLLETLKKAGGHYGVTNWPAQRSWQFVPKGRSHIKAASIGNKLYVGGCNLSNPNDIDCMISWSDKTVSSWIRTMIISMVQTQDTAQAFNLSDETLRIGPNMALLRDAGKPKQSVIYENALELIDEAKQYITITCQYFPGGRTAQHLLAAQARGVTVEILFSPPHAHRKFASLHTLDQAFEHLRLPSDFFAHRLPKHAPKLHAKVLTSDIGTMVGSHNYVEAGVLFGTAEIALRTDDTQLGQQLIQKLKQEIAQY